jgi:hypothetical protein
LALTQCYSIRVPYTCHEGTALADLAFLALFGINIIFVFNDFFFFESHAVHHHALESAFCRDERPLWI